MYGFVLAGISLLLLAPFLSRAGYRARDGAAVLVMQNGKVLLQKGYGYADLKNHPINSPNLMHLTIPFRSPPAERLRFP